MALAYSNLLNSGAPAASSRLSLGSPLSSLSSGAIANAQARGLGSGISINPTGQIAQGVPPQKPVVPKTGVVPTGVLASAPIKPAVPNPTPVASGTPSPTPTIPTPGPATTPPANTTINPTYSGLVGNLVQNAQTTQSQGQMSQAEIDARQRLAGIPGVLGAANAQIESTPSENAVQMGREAVAGRNVEAQRQSLADQVSAYAAERGANTTANTAAGTQLTSAVGAAAPILGAYGQANYNPLNQGAGGTTGAGVSPSDPFYQTLQQYAQLAATNQPGAIPASISSNPVLNAQVLQMAKAINPSFNYNSAQGAASAQEQTTATAGTAEQTANTGIYNTALSNAANLQGQLQNVDGLGSLLLTTAANGGINPTSSKYANMTIAEARRQLSSSQQAQFDSTLATLQSKIGGLLSIGGSDIPTDVTAKSNAILNGTLPLSALSSVVSQIQQEGQIILSNQQGIARNAFSNVQGNSGTQPTSSAGGGVVQTKLGAINTNW